MSHTALLSTWTATTAVASVGSEVLEQAKEGGTLGGQALLFLAVLILGWVVIHLDRRREAARADERAELDNKFRQLMEHHEASVGGWNAERATVASERAAMFNTLQSVVNHNTEAFVNLKVLLDERLKRQ